MPRPFLTAEWKNLLIANYEVDPKILLPYLPCETELDSFNNMHYVSLVGFLFANTKVMGIPVPFHRNFEEVNLRFYVRYKEEGHWKRGVVFIKEIVPRFMISLIANTLYGENYTTHKMKHSWLQTNNGFEVGYQWQVNGNWNFMKAITEKQSSELITGSEEEFITEHYWGYTFINNSCTGVYEVAHPRWKIHKVIDYEIYCNAEKLYGSAFKDSLQQKPGSVFLAEGSPISVMKGSRIVAAQTK